MYVPRKRRRGLGAAGSWYCPIAGAPVAYWQKWAGCVDPSAPSAIAPVGAPTGSALTVPPASGADAQATVDALVNQQMIDQQSLNAQGVTSSVSDIILGSGGAAVSAISSAASSVPWVWIGVGLAFIFGASALGGGSPRRYGR
jgi:hypothetical protein